jgi:hypothetical protein
VDIGSHKENASKQKLEPGFDSIKAGKALAALDPDFRITFRFSFSHTAAQIRLAANILALCGTDLFFRFIGTSGGDNRLASGAVDEALAVPSIAELKAATQHSSGGAPMLDASPFIHSRRRMMTLKQLRTVALAGTLLIGSAAMGYAQSSSTIGAGGSTAGGGSSSTTLGTGGSAAGGGSGGSASTLGVGGATAGNGSASTSLGTGGSAAGGGSGSGSASTLGAGGATAGQGSSSTSLGTGGSAAGSGSGSGSASTLGAGGTTAGQGSSSTSLGTGGSAAGSGSGSGSASTLGAGGSTAGNGSASTSLGTGGSAAGTTGMNNGHHGKRKGEMRHHRKHHGDRD